MSLAVRLLAFGALFGCAVQAHDFWIEPSSFVVEPGGRVAIRFRVGEHFRGETVARDSSRIVAFDHYGPKTTQAVSGMGGFGPAGVLQLSEPGLHMIAYQSTSSSIELDPQKFEAYLREEGLEHVIRERQTRGEQQLTARERFARCVKSILHVGSGGPNAGFDRILNFPVELVPDKSPRDLPLGGELPVRMLREGKALEGTLVVAYPDADPSRSIRARTGKDGRVTLKLDLPGPWLIKAVHMERIEDGEADWQSWWASLTFELPQ